MCARGAAHARDPHNTLGESIGSSWCALPGVCVWGSCAKCPPQLGRQCQLLRSAATLLMLPRVCCRLGDDDDTSAPSSDL